MSEQARTERLLARILELWIARTGTIQKVCTMCQKDAEQEGESSFFEVGERIIAYYARRSAMSGALSGTAASIPKLGAIATILGTVVIDSLFLRKNELEMALCLCHWAGFDIEAPRDQQLAMALASLTAHEIDSSDCQALAQTLGIAMWDYSGRQLLKVAATALSKMWLSKRGFSAWKGLAGMGIGATVNRIETERIGRRCLVALSTRRRNA